MNGSLFELLGIPDPDVKPTTTAAPTPIQSLILIPPGRGRISLHSFLARRYAAHTDQRQAFSATPLKVDDRTATDCSQNFCAITITVPIVTNDRFTLELVNRP